MKISIKLFDSCVEKKVSIKLFESFVSSYLFCNETDIGTVVVVWSSGMEQPPTQIPRWSQRMCKSSHPLSGTVVRQTDSDVTIGQCVVSDRNLARTGLIRHET